MIRAILDAQGGENHNVKRRRSNINPRLVEPCEDIPTDSIFQVANAVFFDHKADCEFKPVIRNSVVHLGLQIFHLHKVAPLHLVQGFLAHGSNFNGVAFSGFQQDLLSAIRRVLDWNTDFLVIPYISEPQVIEVKVEAGVQTVRIELE